MKLNITYYILAFLINLCFCDDFKTVQVKLKQGELSGKEELSLLREQNYYSFKGIPYAQPPIGELRFMPPVHHDGWEEIYEAYDNKPTCYQASTRMRMDEPMGLSGSEDCLYISVYTPNIEGSTPVIAFDYNDNFITGFNGTDTYSPELFMEENIVVVTITHRLGILGYLTTEDNVIPANAGVKDFIMGLNWIKENIKHFGGDPKRVTLMGNRGGAVLADTLLRSEKAKNLFSGVILQSGTALETIFFKDNAKEKAFELGKALNITTDDSSKLLKELQKIDVEQIYRHEGMVVNPSKDKDAQTGLFYFSPTVEYGNPNGIITSLPETSKIVNDVPVMIGMNSREGIDLASHYLFEPKLVADSGQDFLFLFPIRSGYRFDIKSEVYNDAIKEILNYYFEEGYLYYGNLLEYVVYIGDMLQNYSLNKAAKYLSLNSQSPVYYYMFDFRGLLNENSAYISRFSRIGLKPWGATITDELCYLHVCSRIRKTYENILKLVSKQAEIKVLKKMVRLWANFARERNPTPSNDNVLNGFEWQPLRKDRYDTNYLHITKTLNMAANPLGEREKFWDDFLAKYSELVIDGVVQSKPKHEEF